MGDRRRARAGRAWVVMLVSAAAVVAPAASQPAAAGSAAAGGGPAAGLVEAVEMSGVWGPSRVSVAENDYGRVATYWALPPADPDEVRWRLAGSDAAHFTIDDPPGALRLRSAPVGPQRWPTAADFEAPRDADADNVYEVTVAASAPGGAAASVAVAVTVTDVDEAGEVSLSTARPRVGEPVAAALSDPDSVSGEVGWRWERSAGRNAWAPIEGAAAGVYVPSAADAGEHLRVTAVYSDRHGSDKTAAAAFHSVVLAGLLSALSVSTSDSDAAADAASAGGSDAGGSDAGGSDGGGSDGGGSDAGGGVDALALWRLQRPGFDARTLHYSVGCADDDVMTLSFAAADGASRLAVDGVVYPNPGAGRQVAAAVPVGRDSDVVVSVTSGDGSGAETRYVVHCLAADMEPFTVQSSPGATEELLLVARNTDLLILDSNGVVRRHIELAPEDARASFRFYPDCGDGEFCYSYTIRAPYPRHVILDEDLEIIDEEVLTAAPLTRTGTHDFRVLDDGSYLLMAFEPAVRDFSHLTFPDADGDRFGPETESADSAIQVVTPDGEPLLTWNSYDHMALEDCTHHRFPPRSPGWGQINSIGVYNGEIVASFRGCNQVLGIDPATGEVNWRVGPTNYGHPGFASPRPGPAPLRIVGDPQRQFCGQHAASVSPQGRLLLYDNGANCSVDPWTGENLLRPDRTYSRAVEYQLDFDSGEAVYVREHSLGGAAERIGWATGQVERLEGGDWLVSWGAEIQNPPDGPPWPADDVASATLVDPATGAEKLTLLWHPQLPQQEVRVTAMAGWALAPQPRPLTARARTAARFHTGPGDRPEAVVTFNQPVADFTAASPSLQARNAAVTAVTPVAAAGEPAYSYTVTLAPTNATAPVTLALAAGHPCDAGGICTAGGTPLTGAAAPASIPAEACR